MKALVYFNDGDLHTLSEHEKSLLIDAASAVRELPKVAILSKKLAVAAGRDELAPGKRFGSPQNAKPTG